MKVNNDAQGSGQKEFFIFSTNASIRDVLRGAVVAIPSGPNRPNDPNDRDALRDGSTCICDRL